MSTFRQLKDDCLDSGHLAQGVDEAVVGRYLNEVYQHACAATRITRKLVTKTLIADQSDYDVTSDLAITDLLEITNLAYTSPATTQTRNMVPVDQSDIVTLRNLVTGFPNRGRFAFYGNTLELWPTPAAGDAVQIAYVYRPAAMVADSDTPSAIPVEFHDPLLVDGTLARAARRRNTILGPYRYRTSLAGLYQMQYQQDLQDLKRWLAKRNRPEGGPVTVGYPGSVTPRAPRYGDEDWAYT